ncbi:hypothetical protein CFELI_03185 [Corynebacterium felinum]|uniref:Uncharacterized protein n=1 Tax=Corynebacterium felinum TaxID=131318 RepID=A0ABU2BC07_9CORY|nr:hypothetical protein [Corynebacterium felinum]WJY94279.1 hypothetical protein CFELI_03185 [Corynebacterium felinum]
MTLIVTISTKALSQLGGRCLIGTQARKLGASKQSTPFQHDTTKGESPYAEKDLGNAHGKDLSNAHG